MAAVFERHLTILPGLRYLGPVLRATCEQLSEQWTGIVEHTMPQQQKSIWCRGAPLNQPT